MWNIIFYEKSDGTIPVRELFNDLPVKLHAKVIWELELLEQSGTALGMPYVRHIEDRLWELRIKLSSDITRVFYFVPAKETIVLLHGFVKKTQKTPKREIATAKAYLADFDRRKRK